MGKSKHSKWFDDYEENKRERASDWERRRQEKRRAWEQKHSAINPYEHKEDDQEYE